MSGAGKMGDRGGGRESTKSLNKSKQTKHKMEIDFKKSTCFRHTTHDDRQIDMEREDAHYDIIMLCRAHRPL
jgi:hypothetical protein